MNDFELQITQGAIKTNLDDLKKELAEIADRYKDLIIKEKDIKPAKADLANLRKIKKSVDDRRKEIKAEWNKPYEAFEKEVKEAIAIIDEPIEQIDSKLKEFEAQRKNEKELHCRELFEENIGELTDFLKFSDVFRDTWLNKSVEDTEIISDISGERLKVKNDLEAIRALGSEIEDTLIEVYKSSGRVLATAIQKNSDYLQTKALAEKKAEEDAQAKIEAERRAKEEAEQKAAEATKRAEEAEKKAEEPFNEEPKKDYAVFTVRVKNEKQAQQVRQFCEFSDIQYSVIF